MVTPVPAERLTIRCPKCQASVRAARELIGRAVVCPACGAKALLVDRAARKAEATAADEYQLAVETAPRIALPSGPSILAQPPAAIAESAEMAASAGLTAGVYTFPWQLGVATRWLLVSLGLLATSGVVVFVFGAALSDGLGREAVVGAGALSIVIFFLGLLTLSLLSACFLVVVEETSAGAETIGEWPESDWREWFYKFLFLLEMTALSLVAGWAAYQGACAADMVHWGGWLTAIGTAFALFPVLLLSALESGSPVMPFSLPIASSLLRMAPVWLAFYAQMALLLAAVCGVTVLAGWLSVWLAPLVSPLWAAYFFIYARMLGRLGRLIVERLSAPAMEEER